MISRNLCIPSNTSNVFDPPPLFLLNVREVRALIKEENFGRNDDFNI